MDHAKIIGKTLTFDYASETYRIEIETHDRVRWTRTRGETTGKSDTEAYVYSPLTADLALITWIEADGLGLSTLLDFAKRTITTHANMGREVFVNPGTLSIEGAP